MSKINVKLYFKKRKQRLSVFGVSPTFDWRVIGIIGLLVLIAGIVYASILYTRIMNESLFEVVEDENPKIELEQKTIEIQKVIDQLQISNFDEPAVN